MRRLIAFSVLILSLPSFGLVRMGIQGGLSSANISSDPSITTNAKSGFALGAALELGVGSNWNIQIDGLYVTKGYVVPASVVAEQTVKLDYFQVPVLLKYNLDLLLVKIFFTAGPYLAFKTKAQLTDATSATDITTIKSTDLGLSFGGGAEIPLTPVTGIFATLRYDLGLSNVTDVPNNSVKNKGLLVLGGFLFGI